MSNFSKFHISADFTKIEQEALSLNNIFRDIHGSPKLQLNHSLCRDATKWARKLAEKGEIEYDMGTSQGENIYSTCRNKDEKVPIQEAFVKWYGVVDCLLLRKSTKIKEKSV